MLSDKQIKEFDERGFLRGERVLSDEQVQKLRDELEQVMEGKSDKKPVLNRNMLDGGSEYGTTMSKNETVVQIVNIWMASETFLEHAKNEKICAEIAQLCETNELRIWHDQIQYKPPLTGGPTNWHQDHPAWPIIQPADLISAWVALDDATVENGCMWMVPESHKWGDQSKYLASDDNFQPVHHEPQQLPQGAKVVAEPFEIKKGHVGYHHCLTWHGSPHNRSDKKRRAIAVHYMPGYTRYEPTGSHPMEDFVQVAAHQILTGDSFPLVYQAK